MEAFRTFFPGVAGINAHNPEPFGLFSKGLLFLFHFTEITNQKKEVD